MSAVEWGLMCSAIFLPAGSLGYVIGCHRFPSSSPKFRVEEQVVLDARKKLIEQQRARNADELKRLNAAFGYGEDLR